MDQDLADVLAEVELDAVREKLEDTLAEFVRDVWVPIIHEVHERYEGRGTAAVYELAAMTLIGGSYAFTPTPTPLLPTSPASR